MNNIELNAILFYADYMSLKDICQPVTDNCKYFYIHGCPINAAYIINLEPEYDETNKYFIQAYSEYQLIKNKYGEEGIESFIDDICAIRACGSVNAEQMLTRIHQFSDKKSRKKAFGLYYEWRDKQQYSHLTINEDGDPQEKQCTRYVSHTERMLEKRGLLKSSQNYGKSTKKPVSNDVG